eukprot:363625-Chlamydomonas_euryale.AAC.22
MPCCRSCRCGGAKGAVSVWDQMLLPPPRLLIPPPAASPTLTPGSPPSRRVLWPAAQEAPASGSCPQNACSSAGRLQVEAAAARLSKLGLDTDGLSPPASRELCACACAPRDNPGASPTASVLPCCGTSAWRALGSAADAAAAAPPTSAADTPLLCSCGRSALVAAASSSIATSCNPTARQASAAVCPLLLRTLKDRAAPDASTNERTIRTLPLDATRCSSEAALPSRCAFSALAPPAHSVAAAAAATAASACARGMDQCIPVQHEPRLQQPLGICMAPESSSSRRRSEQSHQCAALPPPVAIMLPAMRTKATVEAAHAYTSSTSAAWSNGSPLSSAPTCSIPPAMHSAWQQATPGAQEEPSTALTALATRPAGSFPAARRQLTISPAVNCRAPPSASAAAAKSPCFRSQGPAVDARTATRSIACCALAMAATLCVAALMARAAGRSICTRTTHACSDTSTKPRSLAQKPCSAASMLRAWHASTKSDAWTASFTTSHAAAALPGPTCKASVGQSARGSSRPPSDVLWRSRTADADLSTDSAFAGSRGCDPASSAKISRQRPWLRPLPAGVLLCCSADCRRLQPSAASRRSRFPWCHVQTPRSPCSRLSPVVVSKKAGPTVYAATCPLVPRTRLSVPANASTIPNSPSRCCASLQ